MAAVPGSLPEVEPGLIDGTMGVRMGDRARKHGCRAQHGLPGYFKCASLPQTFHDFEKYKVTAHYRTGICEITATGRNVYSATDGTGLRAEMGKIQTRLARVFGAHRVSDFQRNESTGNWMADLRSFGRFYRYQWYGTDAAPLPQDVDYIWLRAGAVDDETGYVILTIRFNNFKECRRLLEH
ncbi:MAG: hypothetical protein ACPGYL_13835, partial [Rhodospirillaceae bacterium]